jgi:hypothetical protein
MRGKSALWFTTLRPHWLTTCSSSDEGRKKVIFDGIHYTTTRLIKTTLLEVLFSSSFSYFRPRARGAACQPPFYSPFANTRRVFAPDLTGFCTKIRRLFTFGKFFAISFSYKAARGHINWRVAGHKKRLFVCRTLFYLRCYWFLSVARWRLKHDSYLRAWIICFINKGWGSFHIAIQAR